MYKKFVNTIFFVLISIILASCKDPMCYEENDIGNFNNQVVKVSSSQNACSWTDDGQYGSAGSTITNCLSEIKDNMIVGSCQIKKASCVNLREATLSSNTDYLSYLKSKNIEVSNCSSVSESQLETAFISCVNDCEEECLSNTDLSYEPTWVTNITYSGNSSENNINIVQNGQIKIQALGTLTLRKTNESSIEFSVHTDRVQEKPIDATSVFVTGSQNAFSVSGKWCMGGNINNCPYSNRNGFVTSDATDQQIYSAQNFLRRGVMILNNFPKYGFVNSNNEYVGPMLEPNFSYWSCNKPTISQGLNVISDYTCDTNYDKVSDITYLTQNNELYPIEDTFVKEYGGYVVPHNVIDFVTPNVPFSSISCVTNLDGDRVCYSDSSNNEDKKIEPWVLAANNTDNSLATIMKGDILLTSDGLEKKFLYPSKVAFKIPISNNSVGSCNLNVVVDGITYAMNLPVDNKWHFLQDVSSNDIILNKNIFNTLSNSEGNMQNIEDNNLYTVNINFDSDEKWTDESGNEIACGDGMVAFFMPQNEILINKSGFVKFKNLFVPTSSCTASNCLSGNASIKFTIINPLYEKRDNILNTVLYKNFYENINGNENLSPKAEEVFINLSSINGDWSNEIYVRKGQILRFDESNWYDINKENGTIRNKIINLGNGVYKNFSHGLVLKIEPRLALFCPNGTQQEISISYNENGEEIQNIQNLPQCYDLENYKGAFRTLFDGEIKGDVKNYGVLTIDSYDLGARKLSSITQNETYGNLSSFSYSFNNSTYEFSYISDYVLPANKYLTFLVLDNNNLNFTNKNNSSTNTGEYKILFQPVEYLSNGQQLAVALADVNWNGNDNPDTSWQKTTHPVAWLTKYNMDKNSKNYGSLDETTNFEFNNLGFLVKKGTDNYLIDISSENFPNLSYVASDKYNDLRLFFKIIDKYETCNNNIGSSVSETLCKCSNESEDYYRSCYTIKCSGSNTVQQKEITNCNQDIYANNSGSYNIQLESSKTSDMMNNIEKFFSSILMDKLFKLFDGTNVRLKVDSEGKKEYCSSETDSKLCTVFYQDNEEFRLNPGDACVAADNVGQTNGVKYCYNNCNNLTTNEQQRTLCKTFNDGKGFVKKFYQTVISDSTYQRIIKTSFALMFSFYGLYFLLGLADFNQEELIKRLIKISFIYLMISPTGWEYYNNYFVRFFKEGMDYLSFAIVSSFSDEVAINNAMATGNYSDKTVIFGSIDNAISLIISDQMSARIWGLLFTTLPGFVYIILIYWAIIIFLFSVVTAMVIYSMSQVLISFFLAFGPIFFVFLIFDKTKGMFDKWLSNLIGLSFEQIFVLTCASFFNIILYNIIKALFSYRVCSMAIISFGFFDLEFWKASKADIPGLFQILLLFLIAHLSKNFMKLMANLGAGIGGADISSTDLSGGIIDTAGGIVKPMVGAVKKGAKSLAISGAKKLGYQDDDDIKEENKKNSFLRKGFGKIMDESSNEASASMAIRHGENWRDNPEYVKEFEEERKKKFIEKVSNNGKLSGYLADKDLTPEQFYEVNARDLYSSSTLFGFVGNLLRQQYDKSSMDKNIITDKVLSGQTKYEKKALEKEAKIKKDAETAREKAVATDIANNYSSLVDTEKEKEDLENL